MNDNLVALEGAPPLLNVTRLTLWSQAVQGQRRHRTSGYGSYRRRRPIGLYTDETKWLTKSQRTHCPETYGFARKAWEPFRENVGQIHKLLMTIRLISSKVHVSQTIPIDLGMDSTYYRWSSSDWDG